MGLHQRQTHPEFVEGCFGCKIQLLELSTGDARGDVIASGTTQKKWNNELEAYRSARAQGIQPNGTKIKQIQAAHEASEKIGAAYDGNTMIQAKKIDKPTSSSAGAGSRSSSTSARRGRAKRWARRSNGIRILRSQCATYQNSGKEGNSKSTC